MTTFDLLLPRPVSATSAGGTFPLTHTTTIMVDSTGTDAGTTGEPAGPGAVVGGTAGSAANWLSATLRSATGLPLPVHDHSVHGSGAIHFRIDRDAVNHPEGYRLTVSPSEVSVVAADASGAFYAAQAIRQLLGPDAFRLAPVRRDGWTLPCGEVVDRPTFRWRGCLLDVARHFLPKAGVFRFIDLLAAHRLNVLHLHLTDDQGWRIEVPAYPKLVEVGAWRTDSMIGHPPHGRLDGTPHGGYYTTADLREIVAYAADRAITVVPEVDMPGHTQAAIAAYPDLGNKRDRLPVWTSWGVNENIVNVDESTVDFFRTVFDHVVDVFPSQVIGVGGDEVPLAQWAANPAAARRMAELGLADVGHLHGWFVRRIVDHLVKRGRRALGWDEITEAGPIAEGTIIASWRGEEAGIAAARAGHDVVMCPEQYVYLNYREAPGPDEPVPIAQPKTVADVYGYRPVPRELAGPDATTAAAHVLGAQAQVWTEHLDSARRIDYATFPRLAAFAEVVWTSPDGLDFADFERRLATEHLARLDALGVEYRPQAGPLPWQRRPGVRGRPRD